MSGYSVSPQTVEDLFEIWQYIARDKENVADRVSMKLSARWPACRPGTSPQGPYAKTCVVLPPLLVFNRLSSGHRPNPNNGCGSWSPQGKACLKKRGI
jgi:hypothetical protein